MEQFVIEHGDVWLTDPKANAKRPAALGPAPKRHVCDGTGMLAVAYDAEDGTLHKVGNAESVSDWAATTTKKFRDGGFDDIADAIVVVSFPVSPETVEELNACRATTGRVLRLPERLTAIAEARPELLDLPRYPSR